MCGIVFSFPCTCREKYKYGHTSICMASRLLLGLMSVQFSSLQLLSHVRLFVTPWTTARQAFLSITNSRSPPTNPCPLSQWCHQPSHPLSSPSPPALNLASGSFPVSQLFTWGGQSIGVSASTSVLPMNTQDWYPLGWTGWRSLQSKGLSRVFPNTTFKSINSSALSFLHSPTLTSIHDYWKNKTQSNQ